MRTELVKIIENLLTGDRTKAFAYAELLVKNCERKYEQTKDIFDKYEIMGARNIVHMMKGEPKEGGTVVLDDCPGRKEQTVENADKPNQPKTVKDLLKRLDDSANQLHLTAFNNATEDSLRVTLHDFILTVCDYAQEIEEAHGREVAELKNELDEWKSNCNFNHSDRKKKLEQIKELRECLKIIRDNLVLHTIKSDDGKYVNKGAFLSEEFVDDERWRKALRGDVK